MGLTADTFVQPSFLLGVMALDCDLWYDSKNSNGHPVNSIALETLSDPSLQLL